MTTTTITTTVPFVADAARASAAEQWKKTSQKIQGLGFDPFRAVESDSVRSKLTILPIDWLSLYVHALNNTMDPDKIAAIIHLMLLQKKKIDDQTRPGSPMAKTNEFYTQVCLPLMAQKDPTGIIRDKINQGWCEWAANASLTFPGALLGYASYALAIYSVNSYFAGDFSTAVKYSPAILGSGLYFIAQIAQCAKQPLNLHIISNLCNAAMVSSIGLALFLIYA